MAAISTIALATAVGVGAAGTIHSAVEARKSRKDQAEAQAKAEGRAKEVQAQQEALAKKEKQASDIKLKEQQQRLLKSTTKGGLLFGGELGTEDTKKQTLGE